MFTPKHLRAALLAGVALSGLSSVQAFAEVADASPSASAELEPIVVTAQRRTERLQDVPISITSVSAKTLEQSNFRSVTDLQYLVPGVQFETTNGTAFNIRGVGSTSWDFSNEKSVSLVVDDVVMDAQRDNGLTGLADIQQIDVLMGPQGTLFGKNATSGVISVITVKPVLGAFSGKGDVAYGDREDRAANLTLNIPLGEKVALRVSGFAMGQDGYGRYTVLNQSLNAFKEHGYRAKLLFAPNDRVELVYSSDYARHWDNNNRTTVSGGSAFFTGLQIANGVTPSLKNDSNADSKMGSAKNTSWGQALRGQVQVGRDTLTSITSYRDTRFIGAGPGDFAPTDKWAFVPFNQGTLKSWKFSQELRWASPTGGFFEYLGGVFYNRLSQDATQIQWATFGAPLPVTNITTTTGVIGDPGNAQRFRTTNITEAAFGQLKFNVSPKLSLSVGGRYTRDDNSQTESFFWKDPVPLAGAPMTFTPTGKAPSQPSGQVKGDNVSYRLAGQYRLNEDAMVYVSYATGYKPGGAAFVGNNYSPYKDETVKSLEAGIKSELFDHRVRLNADVFRSEFTDFQTSLLTFVPGNPVAVIATGNAGGLKSQGFETTFAWRATDGLTLSGGVTYADAKFTDFVYNATTNYGGTRLTNAPKWQGSFSANYDREIGAYRLRANLDYAHRTRTWSAVGQAANTELPGYGIANGRVSLSPENGGVEVGIYGRNLLDKYFSTAFEQYSTMSLTHRVSRDAHRTVGVFAKYAF
jgi:iron complex outermembrane receptor protein